MHRLQAPLVPHELDGQPVQQFAVRRPAAQLPEITGSLHDPAPEVPVPETVHHHPRRHRVVGTGNPLCERHPPAAGRPALEGIEPDPGRILVPRDAAEEAWLHHLTRVVILPPDHHPGGGHPGLVGRAVGVSQRHGQRLQALEVLPDEVLAVGKHPVAPAFLRGHP